MSSPATAGKMDIGHTVQKALYRTLADSQLRSHTFSGYFRILPDHLPQMIRRIQAWFDILCGTLRVFQSAIGTLCGTLRFTDHNCIRITFGL